ncbi:Drug resistance [Hyphodiscus hymeniophilus]|uniref:Drug resistance n=1 Tax=Hyphodiscus hymeniophilus TaxID=353542 RepID=A0A9P6VLE2_9HELO|nr:Drug resistance [Hyphodiscus hymeniophilus]
MSELHESAMPSPIQDGQDLERQDTKPDVESRGNIAAHLTQSTIERPQTLLHETAFVFILCMSQLMCQAALGQSIAPARIIGRSFGTTNPGQLSWFPAAYSLTVGTFILIAGRLGDLYGHKKLFIGGFAWFALWSLLAGFSVYSNEVFFDCCRAFQGIGPAFTLPNAIAIMGRSYSPGTRKQMVFSLNGAMAPTGFVIGAVFSSLLAEFAWWPWAYWITAIVCVVFVVMGHLIIPYTAPPFLDDSVSMWSRVDALGSITGVSGLVLVNFAWNQAPIVGWTNAYTYVLLIVGIVFLGLFGYIESRHAKFPLIPFAVMDGDVGFLLACVAFGWASFSLWMYYFWQFLENLRNVSPLLASAQFSPVVMSGFCAALTTGYILHRVPGSIIMMIALSAFMVGLILLATAPVGQTYWAQTFVSLIIMPWGMDMSFPAATLLLSNAMPKEHQGVAASLVSTIVNYSISIALGVGGTIEGHINDGGKDILRGYRGAWYLGIGLAGSGVILSFLFGFDNWRKARRAGIQDGKMG